MSTLSIIIPVYNEANTIKQILEKVVNIELIDNIKKEIILVNDCSKDNSESIIKTFITDTPGENIKIFNHQVNQGKGAALKTGIQNASGDFIVIQDADLEYDPDE